MIRLGVIAIIIIQSTMFNKIKIVIYENVKKQEARFGTFRYTISYTNPTAEESLKYDSVFTVSRIISL